MSSPVEVRFTPEPSGWAHCTVTIGGASHTVEGVSYTTDPLGDLLRGALMIATGGIHATLSFDGEPMETRWLLERGWHGPSGWVASFRVRLMQIQDIYRREPDAAGIEVLSATCNPQHFAEAVLLEAERLLRPENNSWLTGPTLTFDGLGTRPATRALRAALND